MPSISSCWNTTIFLSSCNVHSLNVMHSVQKQTQAHMVNGSLTRVPRIHSGEKIIFSINGARKIKYPHAQKKKKKSDP